MRIRARTGLALLCLGLAGCASGQSCPPTGACEPVYEEVDVPVYACRAVPQTRTVQVPRYVWREEPVYREWQEPVHGCRTVPVMIEREVPVTVVGYDPNRCQEVEMPLFTTTEPFQIAVRREPAIVGYRTCKVCCGTRRVRVQDGYETRTAPCAPRQELVQVGTRKERRLVGWQPAAPAGPR